MGAGVQRLKHHVAGAVAELATGDVAVLYGHDGVVRVCGLKVVHHDLAAVAKLEGDGVRQALVEVELGFLHASPRGPWSSESLFAPARNTRGAILKDTPTTCL